MSSSIRAVRHGKPRRELIPVSLDERPVVARAGQHQDDRIHAAVAQLQGEAPFECLEVGRSRLRLHADSPACATDESVPRTQVAGDRQRHFGSPADRAMDVLPQLAKESHVGAIADRLAGRIGARGDLQPDDRQEPAEPGERDVRRQAALDSGHLLPAQPDRPTDVCLAQAPVDPRPPELGREFRRDSPSPIGAHRCGAAASPHLPMIGTEAYLPLTGSPGPAWRAPSAPRSAGGTRRVARFVARWVARWVARRCSRLVAGGDRHPGLRPVAVRPR